jgi:hypothetical protein
MRSGLETRLSSDKTMKSVYDDLADVWTTSLRYNPSSRVVSHDLMLYRQLLFLYEFIQETVP